MWILVSLLGAVVHAIGPGPEWNNHPLMTPSIEKYEIHKMVYMNISYPDGDRMVKEVNVAGEYGLYHDRPVYGLLVHVRSGTELTGCRLPLTTKDGPLPDEPWIALIRRGECSFQTKMENAYNSNATGMLVYDEEINDKYKMMNLGTNVPREFGAVFTSKEKGEALAKLVDNGTRVMIYMTLASTITIPTTVNKTSVLFVTVSFIILMVVSLGWIIFYYVQKCRYIHAKDKLSKRLCSAAKKALQKIPTRYIKSDEKNGNGLGDEDCCAICIELFKPAEVVRLLPCKHEFHKLCIDPWLLENRTCPMCKMDILKYFGFELTGSQESMLRSDHEDPFNDFLFYNQESVLDSSIVPVTMNNLSQIVIENRPNTSDASTNATLQAILDSDAENSDMFGNCQKIVCNRCEVKSTPLRKTVSLSNIPSTNCENKPTEFASLWDGNECWMLEIRIQVDQWKEDHKRMLDVEDSNSSGSIEGRSYNPFNSHMVAKEMDTIYPEPIKLRLDAPRKKRGSQNRYRTQPVTFSEIKEVDEETTNEEDAEATRRMSADANPISKSATSANFKHEEFWLRGRRDRRISKKLQNKIDVSQKPTVSSIPGSPENDTQDRNLLPRIPKANT